MILAALFAVMIGLSFSTATFAQATPATPATPAAPATPAPAGGEMKKDEGMKKGEKKAKKKKNKEEKKAEEALTLLALCLRFKV